MSSYVHKGGLSRTQRSVPTLIENILFTYYINCSMKLRMSWSTADVVSGLSRSCCIYGI